MPCGAQAQDKALGPDFAADARELERIVADNYAYLERFEGGQPPRSAALDAMRDGVDDRRKLLTYAEAVVLSLADHHAITGASFKDSRALVPSYADLWIVREAGGYRVDAVRSGSPAASAGIAQGDALVAVDGAEIEEAVSGLWREIGLQADNAERRAFAARVLAAGRRDRPRDLSFRGRDGRERRVTLPNLYAIDRPARPPVTVTPAAGGARIAFNDSLGDDATIAAFDAAMATLAPRTAVELDLTDTPSGGNTTVARAIMGWFVSRPSAYQTHSYPAEERRTGIPRQWTEYVLARPGKHHRGPVTVRVGRWTGSMGEGLALGFDAIGGRVVGGRMAGLLGAIYDFPLPASGLVVKLPAERLMHVDGTPREAFRPLAAGGAGG